MRDPCLLFNFNGAGDRALVFIPTGVPPPPKVLQWGKWIGNIFQAIFGSQISHPQTPPPPLKQGLRGGGGGLSPMGVGLNHPLFV